MELIEEIKRCQKCNSIIGHRKFPATYWGNQRRKYLMVSDAPLKESISRRQYWTGVGGNIIRTCSMAAHTTIEDIFYLTNIVKCWPNEKNNNRKPFVTEIFNCSKFLIREINELKPALIVSFGKLSSSILLNREVMMKEEHGNIYSYNEHSKILLLLHPTGVERQMEGKLYQKQITTLFKKLKEGRHEEVDSIFCYQ